MKVVTSRQSRRGFTVIEVLIAFGLIAVGFSGVLTLLAQGTSAHRNATQNTTASLLAASVLADVEANFESKLDDRGNLIRQATWADSDRNGKPDRLERLTAPGGRVPTMPVGFPSARGFTYTVQYEYPTSQSSSYDATQKAVLVRVNVGWQDDRGFKRVSEFFKVIYSGQSRPTVRR